jgi:dUTP pyrophosphatase
VANAPGTIDAGYRGEVQVLLVNLGDETVQLRRGDRVAQLLLQRVGHARVIEVDELDDTARGAGGFGSTGGSSAG